MDNTLYNFNKFQHYFPGQGLHINVVGKFNLIRNLSGLTEASAICGTDEVREYNKRLIVTSKIGWEGVSVFVDDLIYLVQYPELRSEFNVALLSESKGIKITHYQQLSKFQKYFDLILTHDFELLKQNASKVALSIKITIAIAITITFSGCFSWSWRES